MEVLCAVCRPSCLGVWESPTGDGGRGTVVGSQEWESQKCSDFAVTNVPTHRCTQRKVPDLHQLLHSMQLAQAPPGVAPRTTARGHTVGPGWTCWTVQAVPQNNRTTSCCYLLIYTHQGIYLPCSACTVAAGAL